MAVAEKRTLLISAQLRDLLSAPLTKMEKNMTRFGVVASRALTGATVAVAALVGGAVLGFRSLLHVAEGLEEVANASVNLGITAESLTAIRNAAEQSSVSIEQLGVAMKSFSKLADEANEGGKKQRETLDRLGLSAADFQDKQIDVVDVLAKVADALGKLDSATARTRLLVDLFGKSGVQMGDLLKLGGEGIRKVAEEAERMGVVFSGDELQRVKQFTDSWKALQQALRGLAERLVVDIAPAFTAFFDDLRNHIVVNGVEIAKGMQDVVGLIVNGLEVLVEVLRRVSQVVQGFRTIVSVMSEVAIGALQLAAHIRGDAAAVKIWDDASKFMAQRTDELVDGLVRLDNAGETTAVTFKQLRERLAEFARQRAEAMDKGVGKVGGDKKDPIADPSIWAKYWAGFDKGADEAIKKWKDFGTAGKEAATSIIDGGLNALVDETAAFITHTKSLQDAWKSFAQSVLVDLAKITVKLLAMEAISFLRIGAEDGGVLPAMSRGGVKSYAGGGLNRNGGVATRPTVLFGEGRNAEAFVPLPDNRSIPVSFVGGGPSTGSHVTIVINAVDSKDVKRMLFDEKDTLNAIWENGAMHRTSMRHTIQRSR